MRVGHEINPPSIVNVGVNLAEAFSRFAMKLIGEYFGVPLYKAEWDMIYVTPNAPGNIQSPPPL